MASPGAPSRELQSRDTPVLDRLLAGEIEFPPEVTNIIDIRGWALSLVKGDPYEEPDPDFLSRQLMIQTLSAMTEDEVFSQTGIRSLQKSIPDVPGGSSGPIEIYGLYVTDSDFKEGARTYVILSTRDLETGFEVKYTTGASQIQAQILAALSLGIWPIRCKIVRTERKDKGGKFLFWLAPADAE